MFTWHRKACIAFIVVSVFILALQQAAVSAAIDSKEVVVNGGFETGNFYGWTADYKCEVRPHSASGAWFEPSRSGQYSARLGGYQTSGTIKQEASLPKGCRGTFSFWYRVEKDCRLDVRIRRKDGSTVMDWTKMSSTGRLEEPWLRETYNIGTSLGEDLVIELSGIGSYQPPEYRYEWQYDPFTKKWYLVRILVTPEQNFWPYVDDVSLVAEKTSYEVTVSVSGLPSKLLTNIVVDGSAKFTISSGQKFTVTFDAGTSHRIQVDSELKEGDRLRYQCVANSIDVSDSLSHDFRYVALYLLGVTSPYGSLKGGGWYEAGSVVKISVEREVQPNILIKYVFKGWSGDYNGADPEATITVDSPKVITAQWQADYTALIVLLAAAAAATGGGVVFFLRRHRRATPAAPLGVVGPESIRAGAPSKPVPDAAGVTKEVKEVKEVPAPKIVPIVETSPALDGKVYNYILEHEGAISISQAARDLAVTQDELNRAIERLRSQGKLG